MKYLAYFLLLALFVYFLIVKPFLLARNIEFHLSGLVVDLKSLSFGIREFYVYIPSKERDLFVSAYNVLLKKTTLKAKEVNVVQVSKVVSKKPFDYNFSNLTRRLSKLNAEVDSIYVSINSLPYKESVAVFVGATKLSGGILQSKEWAQAYLIHETKTRKIGVLLDRAHIDGSTFYVDDAKVVGDYFVASLKAKWIGKKGTFSGKLEVDEIKTAKVIVARTTAFVEGEINYTSVNSKLKVFSPYVEVVDKKRWTNISGDLTFHYRLNEGMSLEGSLYSQNLQAQLNYVISPKSKLSVIFKGFEVDNKVLGLEKKVSAVMSGKLDLSLKDKKLTLSAVASPFRYDIYSFDYSVLDLNLDYGDRLKGNFRASLSGKGNIQVDGYFFDKNVSGMVRVADFEYMDVNVKLLLNYIGGFEYREGTTSTVGRGIARNVVYGGNHIGDFSFNFQLLKDTYSINLEGEGVKVVGGGSFVEKTFQGDVFFNDFNYSQDIASVKNVHGTAVVSTGKDRAYFDGKLRGNLYVKEFRSQFDGTLKIESAEGLHGSFDFSLRDISREKNKLFSTAVIKGNIENSVLGGQYSVEDVSRGRFIYNIRKNSYSVNGRVDKKSMDYSLSFDFKVNGTDKYFSGSLKGLANYKGSNIPLDADLTYSKNGWKGYIKGFRTNVWALDVKVEDALFDGLKVDWKGLRVALGKDEIFTLSTKTISLDIQNKIFNFDGILDGSVKGNVLASYDTKEGLKIKSQGSMDMNRVSRIIRSKLPGIFEGDLYYLYRFTNSKQELDIYTKEKITFVSRYIGVPLAGTLNVSYDGQTLNGKAKFEGNGSEIEVGLRGNTTALEAKTNVKKLLLVYRSDSFRYRGTSDAYLELKTNLKELDIKGSVTFVEGYLDIISLAKGNQDKKEEYKNVSLNVAFRNTKPLRIKLPEGYTVANLSGSLLGTLYEPKYSVDVSLLGGKLTYFGKDFFIRQGKLDITHEDKKIEVSLSSPTPDYNIIMDVTGNINYPKVVVRSDPPRDQREVLSALIGGGTSQGLIAVDQAILSQFPEFGLLKRTVSNIIGTDINVSVSPVISANETGITTKVSKDFTDKLSAEYQHSTIKNPKETYAEGSAKLVRGSSISARMYSDQSKEVRIRIQRKFDLK